MLKSILTLRKEHDAKKKEMDLRRTKQEMIKVAYSVYIQDDQKKLKGKLR